jgi:hypothetical protein
MAVIRANPEPPRESGGGHAMTGYRVVFFKYLLSSDGHLFKCLQYRVEIRRAKNADRAIKAAERRYERLRHVRDWRLYADAFELEACSPV